MCSTPSLTLLQGPLLPRVVAPVKDPSMSQIFKCYLFSKQFNCVQMNK